MYGFLKQNMGTMKENVHMAPEKKEVECLGLVEFLKRIKETFTIPYTYQLIPS
jgi:hypothetical protein